MGRLSDEQIREFYIMQKLDGYGEDAIVELMRTEKKTREEIELICGIRQEDNNLITPEIKAAILADAEKGMSYGQLAIKYKMDAKTVGYHVAKAKKQGVIPSTVYTKKVKEPESEPELVSPASTAEDVCYYAMSYRLEKFATEVFGTGLSFISGRSSDIEKMAELEFITSQGKRVKLSIAETE